MSKLVWQHVENTFTDQYKSAIIEWCATQGLDANTLTPEAYVAEDEDGTLTFHYQQVEIGEDGLSIPNEAGTGVISHNLSIVVPNLPPVA